ncbi:FAD/NAD(P)-binding domain-containing protein [Decorospora gaudefroyi]|uniref:FAD/NAD(P)-binding domain-containing protein n=1 Tax=Decorospora gaudefroyi TaxID=184978 RepID=A0A6A5KJG0_9PLEO|nr:FAD/NAD(P)-binding domain-containing protein [Decorospora gaudefroyi]
MWPLAPALLALALLTTVSALPHPRCEQHPVCIVGAGPAGLAAAGRLEQKGIKSVMFDRQAEVGGKCQAYYDEQGIFHPLGAAFFSNATYPDTIAILNQTDVSIEDFALTGTRDMYRFNFTNGAIDSNPSLTPQFTASVISEIPRYVTLWKERFAPYSVVNYKNGVPEEFTVSGAEWFRRNNFTALPILLVNPLALYGYGDINIVPALYILQYFTPDILTAFIGLHSVYYMDFHKMFVEYARNQLCNTTIHTSSEVRCVDRSGPNPVLTYTAPSGSYVSWNKQECASVIFAFPPSLENLERIGLDMTELEYNTFHNVTTHQYYSSAVDLELPFGVSFIANSSDPSEPPPNVGQPVALLHLSEESNVSIAWSWGPYDYQTEEAAFELLTDSLAKINLDPRNATTTFPQPFCPDDVKAFEKWDYFPHFESDALSEGAYNKLNLLQGQKKSYYASGLSGMEIVEWAIRGGYDVVDTYF